jgi:hypothetical protein
MKSINISLSRNHSEQDWLVEIDGRLYDHVSTEALDDLAVHALAAAQRRLLAIENSTDRSESDSVLASD